MPVAVAEDEGTVHVELCLVAEAVLIVYDNLVPVAAFVVVLFRKGGIGLLPNLQQVGVVLFGVLGEGATEIIVAAHRLSLGGRPVEPRRDAAALRIDVSLSVVAGRDDISAVVEAIAVIAAIDGMCEAVQVTAREDVKVLFAVVEAVAAVAR